MSSVRVHPQFDTATGTLTYVVWDAKTRDAVIIDPVLDYDPATQLISRASMDRLLGFVRRERLSVKLILETHAHADHLSSSRELREALPGAQWMMGHAMKQVFDNFHKVFAWPKDLTLQDLGVDRFILDQEEFTAGSLRFQAHALPGHTPACMAFEIEGHMFTGDALLMPDSGVGRCDFPGGSAHALYDSIWTKLYSRPDSLQIYPGHDYQQGGRPLRYRSTLGEQRKQNVHLRSDTSREDFVKCREGRDKTLPAPRLLNPSLDWNLGAHRIVKRPK